MSDTTARPGEDGGRRQKTTARSSAGPGAGGSGAYRYGVTLYRGGRVYSPVSPRATALLVNGGEVAWVGEEAAADGLSAETTVDLQGAFVAPAFIDAHVSLPAAGLLADALDLSWTVSLAHALAEIEKAAAGARAAQVLIARGGSATRWPEGRLPSPPELDARAHGLLVYLVCPDSASGLPTAGVASSALLRAVPDSDLDPSRDGFATGAAHELIWAELAAAAGRTQRRAAYEAARTAAARAGVAGLHCFAPPGPAGAVIAAELAEFVGAARPGANDQDDESAGAMNGPVFWAAEVAEATRVGARPGGFVVDSSRRDGIAAVVAAASRAGIQTSWVARDARAVGDVVVGMARAVQEVGPAVVRAAAHRIEGVESVDEPDLARLSELGVVVVACPRARSNPPLAALAAAGVPLALGGGALSVPYPFDPWGTTRAAVRAAGPAPPPSPVSPPYAGPGVAPGSAPPGSAAPGSAPPGSAPPGSAPPGSALSVRAAFAASTRGGWRAAREDADGSGQLVPGSPATLAIWEIQGDLAVRAPDSRVAAWSTDPRAGVGGLPDLDGPAPRCLRTLRRGLVVYDGGSLGAR